MSERSVADDFHDKFNRALVGAGCTSPDGTMIHEATRKVADLAYHVSASALEASEKEVVELRTAHETLRQSWDQNLTEADAKLATAQARIEELEGALKPFVEGAGHARVFLTSREKMHPTGVGLYDEDVTRARAALSPRREGKNVVQTITIREENGTWFATSEDEPYIFISANSRKAMNAGLAHTLHPLPDNPPGALDVKKEME